MLLLVKIIKIKTLYLHFRKLLAICFLCLYIWVGHLQPRNSQREHLKRLFLFSKMPFKPLKRISVYSNTAWSVRCLSWILKTQKIPILWNLRKGVGFPKVLTCRLPLSTTFFLHSKQKGFIFRSRAQSRSLDPSCEQQNLGEKETARNQTCKDRIG